MKIHIKDIPYFLTLGQFYPTLEGEEFEIDEENIIYDLSVNTEEKFFLILRIASYWQLYRLPTEIYVFFLFNREIILEKLKEMKEVPHIREYFEDFNLSIGLLKYKNDILEFISFKKLTLTEDEVSIINLLKETTYYTLSFTCESKTKNGIITNGNKYTNFEYFIYVLTINISSGYTERINIPDKIFKRIESNITAAIEDRIKVLFKENNLVRILKPLYDCLQDNYFEFPSKFNSIKITELNRKLMLSLIEKCNNEYISLFKLIQPSLIEDFDYYVIIDDDDKLTEYIDRKNLIRDDTIKVNFCKLTPSFL
jgi:hypothetical protein